MLQSRDYNLDGNDDHMMITIMSGQRTAGGKILMAILIAMMIAMAVMIMVITMSMMMVLMMA